MPCEVASFAKVAEKLSVDASGRPLTLTVAGNNKDVSIGEANVVELNGRSSSWTLSCVCGVKAF